MNEAFLRNYRKILTALLILLLIPLTVACFYDRPLGDELIQSLDAARAWRESGSLLQTFQKAFQMMARDYQTRSGIFFSMLLFAMPLSVFGGNWLVGVNALLTILLMLYGFWRVAGCLQSLCRGVSQEAVRCAGLLLGLAESLVFIWVFFLAITIFFTGKTGENLMGMVNDSLFLRFLYSNNYLLKIISAIVLGV